MTPTVPFLLLFLSILHGSSHALASASNSSYSFAILSDIHIGDAAGTKVVNLAKDAVSWINRYQQKYNIQYVFVTGDLTNSAMDWQYTQVKSILDGLKMPYYPSLGNHDVWSYNSSWEELHPTGDAKFAKTFMDRWQSLTVYNNETVWNYEQNIYSWFQNWELRVGNLVFLSLDWNSRHHAVSELGYKGAMPGAQLHNFTGGTFQWLGERLSAIGNDVKQIVFLQHHPYRTPWYIPDYIYGFSGSQKAAIRSLLKQYQPVEKYWGVFAGHFHMWDNSTAFDEWPTFRQWETEACKSSSAISIVTVENDRVVNEQKHYGTQQQHNNKYKYRTKIIKQDDNNNNTKPKRKHSKNHNRKVLPF